MRPHLAGLTQELMRTQGYLNQNHEVVKEIARAAGETREVAGHLLQRTNFLTAAAQRQDRQTTDLGGRAQRLEAVAENLQKTDQGLLGQFQEFVTQLQGQFQNLTLKFEEKVAHLETQCNHLGAQNAELGTQVNFLKADNQALRNQVVDLYNQLPQADPAVGGEVVRVTPTDLVPYQGALLDVQQKVGEVFQELQFFQGQHQQLQQWAQRNSGEVQFLADVLTDLQPRVEQLEGRDRVPMITSGPQVDPALEGKMAKLEAQLTELRHRVPENQNLTKLAELVAATQTLTKDNTQRIFVVEQKVTALATITGEVETRVGSLESQCAHLAHVGESDVQPTQPCLPPFPCLSAEWQRHGDNGRQFARGSGAANIELKEQLALRCMSGCQELERGDRDLPRGPQARHQGEFHGMTTSPTLPTHVWDSGELQGEDRGLPQEEVGNSVGGVSLRGDCGDRGHPRDLRNLLKQEVGNSLRGVGLRGDRGDQVRHQPQEGNDTNGTF